MNDASQRNDLFTVQLAASHYMRHPELRFVVVPSSDGGYAVRDLLRALRDQQMWAGWFPDEQRAKAHRAFLIDNRAELP